MKQLIIRIVIGWAILSGVFAEVRAAFGDKNQTKIMVVNCYDVDHKMALGSGGTSSGHLSVAVVPNDDGSVPLANVQRGIVDYWQAASGQALDTSQIELSGSEGQSLLNTEEIPAPFVKKGLIFKVNSIPQ